MKRFLSIILAIAIIMVSTLSVTATSDEKQQLSALSDEECIAFLNEYNVDIPTILEDEMSWLLFVRMVIEKVEEDPNVQFPYNYSVLAQFANNIKSAVLSYYGIEDLATFTLVYNKNNILQDNELYGDWDDDYTKFNCYEYAIDYITWETEYWLDPGMLTWIREGKDADTYYYDCYEEISQISSLVVEDLEKLGYQIVSRTQTIPDVDISYHTNLICVRKDFDGIPWYEKEGILYYFHDYHFMKMMSDGNWYHKPGATHLLKYKYTPSNGTAWRSEGYSGTNESFFYDNELTYDSNIYYIQYLTPHEWEYTSNGSGQHTKTCSICDYEETETCRPEYTNLTNTRHSVSCAKCDYYIASQACQLNYRAKDGKTHTVSCAKCENRRTQNCSIVSTFVGAGQHENVCSKCGHEEAEACTISHTYAGDGSQSHTHNAVCTVCGNQSQTGTACTFVYRSHGDNTHSYLCSMCGYVKIDHALCLFNANNICRTCGTPKNGAVINKQEEVTLE